MLTKVGHLTLDGQRVTLRNAERLVRACRSDLQIESHKESGGKRYYLTRGRDADGSRSRMWFSSGDTKATAWLDAARKIAASNER